MTTDGEEQKSFEKRASRFIDSDPMAFEFFTDYNPAQAEQKQNAMIERELRRMVDEVNAEVMSALEGHDSH